MKVDSKAAMIRAVATPGITIRVVNHWQAHLIGTTRKPIDVQTNGYWFMGPRPIQENQDGKTVRMWCGYPKASNLRFNEDGSVTFCEVPSKSWTLAFELEQVQQ